MSKRLNTKLDALEQQNRLDGTLTPAEKQMLVSILARRDALWWPWRWTVAAQPPFTEIRQRQREYLAGTVGIAAKADGRSNWKDSHELRNSLIAAGLLTATHSSGQVQSVFLTPLGESTARALVGDRLRTAIESRFMFLLLGVLSEDGKPVRESVLFGIPCTGSPSDWEDRVEQVQPLLTSGCVRADSDTCGRVLFTLTGAELPEAIVVTVQEEDGFDELYIQSFDSERNTLANAEPRDTSEIYVPISASLHWPKAGETIDEK